MRRLLASLFYVLLLVILTEVLLRYHYKGVSPTLLPSMDSAVMGQSHPNQTVFLRDGKNDFPPAQVKIDSDGFRTQGEGDSKRVPDLFCLGDEMTFGVGLNDDQTYPFYLQQKMRERTPQGMPVVNGGYPGLGPLGLRDFLKEKISRVGAKTFILQISSNDFLDPTHGESMATSEPKKISGFKSLLHQHVAIFNWLGYFKKKIAKEPVGQGASRSIQSPVDYFGTPKDLSQMMRGWQKTAEVWQEVCLIVRRANKNLLVVLVPHQKQMADGVGVNLYQNPVKEIFQRECQLRVIDPLDRFRQVSQQKPLYFEKTSHLNSDGSALLAEIVAQEIIPR